MIAKAIMPHIFFTSCHAHVVMPDSIRASIDFHGFSEMDCRGADKLT
jgi:hypothetical protein